MYLSGNQSKANTRLAAIAGYLGPYGSVVRGRQNKRDRKQTFVQYGGIFLPRDS